MVLRRRARFRAGCARRACARGDVTKRRRPRRPAAPQGTAIGQAARSRPRRLARATRRRAVQRRTVRHAVRGAAHEPVRASIVAQPGTKVAATNAGLSARLPSRDGWSNWPQECRSSTRSSEEQVAANANLARDRFEGRASNPCSANSRNATRSMSACDVATGRPRGPFLRPAAKSWATHPRCQHTAGPLRAASQIPEHVGTLFLLTPPQCHYDY